MQSREAVDWWGKRRRELSLRDGYACWAATYDTDKNGLIAIEEPHVDQLLADIPLGFVLDLATGTGRHALRLAARGARVTALDQSPEMLTAGRQAAIARGLAVDFLLARIDLALPFVDSAFDLVVCALAICHLPDIDGLLHEYARVLRSGGHLLISDFHPDCIAAGLRTDFSIGEARYRLPNAAHTRQGYVDAAIGAGFQIVAVRDVPVTAIPPGYAPEQFIREYRDVNFCLLLLGRRNERASVRQRRRLA